MKKKRKSSEGLYSKKLNFISSYKILGLFLLKKYTDVFHYRRSFLGLSSSSFKFPQKPQIFSFKSKQKCEKSPSATKLKRKSQSFHVHSTSSDIENALEPTDIKSKIAAAKQAFKSDKPKPFDKTKTSKTIKEEKIEKSDPKPKPPLSHKRYTVFGLGLVSAASSQRSLQNSFQRYFLSPSLNI